MSQTHAVTLPSRSRIYWLASLVLVTLVLALVTLAIVQDDGGDQIADASPAMGTVRYGDFNPATGRPHSAPFPQDSRPPLSTVRPDESVVGAAVGGGHRLRFACQVAGRDLTPAEWSDVLPDRDYRRTCPP